MTITINSILPAVATILAGDSLSFVVTTPAGTPLTQVIVSVKFSGLEVEEVAYAGDPAGSGAYRAAYAVTSSVAPVTSPGNESYQFTLRRGPKWPDNPELQVYAFNSVGVSATASGIWLVTNPPAPSLPSSALDQSPAVTGGGLACNAPAFDQGHFLRSLDGAYPFDYLDPMKRAPDSGYETMQSAAKVAERVSLAISRLECGSLVLSAMGGAKATGTAVFSRTLYSNGAYTVQAGTIVGTPDGRNFVTTSDAVFGATDLGPHSVGIEAMFTGYEYNLPGQVVTLAGDILPGSINTIVKMKTAANSFDEHLEVSQPLPTSGGGFPALDALGEERGMPRQTGESDDQYRMRVFDAPDTISPAAICRAVRKIFAPMGFDWCCLRESGNGVGGFFYDAGSSADSPQHPERNYAYDMDPTVNPSDTWKLYLNADEFRAFFLVGVPPLFGGDPVLSAPYYKSVWAAINAKRAGGVGFDLYLETHGCAF